LIIALRSLPNLKVASENGRTEDFMTKLIAILVLAVSLLMVAPVIQSGTPGYLPVFQAIGNASDGAGD
jgi:hypothetical protein